MRVSEQALRRTLIVLTVLGIALASYLTYVHYAGIKPACTAGESCTKVQTSTYSKLAGVPVALIGLIGYITILASLLVPQGETTRLATMAITLIGFGFSAYLTYREGHSIHAYCEECLTSAGFMTVLMGLSTWRFLRGEQPPPARTVPAHAAASETTLTGASS